MSKLDAAVLISQAVFGIWVIRIFHKERRERKAESRRGTPATLREESK